MPEGKTADSKQESQSKTSLSADERAYLNKAVTDNLTHARHVESERLTLFAAFLATTGTVLGLIARTETTLVYKLIILGFLICFGIITIVLFSKWKHVFHYHWNAAQTATEWLRQDLNNTNLCSCDFCFDYDYTGNQNKVPMLWLKDKIHTGDLFIVIAHCITIALIVLFILAL